MPMEIILAWCKKHNATLIEARENGFCYQLSNGEWWWIGNEEVVI